MAWQGYGMIGMAGAIGSDVTAQLGWLMARLRHLADQKWL